MVPNGALPRHLHAVSLKSNVFPNSHFVLRDLLIACLAWSTSRLGILDLLRKMMVWKQLFSRKIEPNLKSACPRVKIKTDIKNNHIFDVRCSEWSISERKIASPRHLFRLIFEKNRILLKSSQLFSGCFNQKNKGTFSSSIFLVV